MRIAGVMTKLFGSPLEISSPEHLFSSLYRWPIISHSRFNVYLEHSEGNDTSCVTSSDPESFIAFGVSESDSANNVQGSGDRGKWMVLIEKSSH